jgi:cell division septation protein DedD
VDEPRTHYQLSFTARQALLLFVGLLGALAVAYVFGLMTGLAGRDGTGAPGTSRTASGGALSPTAEALEVPRAVRGVSPFRGAPRAPTAGRIAAVVSTPLPDSPAPTPSPGLHLFEDVPEAGATAAAAGDAARKPAGKGKPTPRVAASGAFWVQALSAGSEKEARGRLDRLKARGFSGTVSSASGPSGKIYRVRIGPYGGREEADKVAARLKSTEKLRPWVVPPGK